MESCFRYFMLEEACMPKQTGKSSLASKLGDRGREAFDSHKSDETTYGQVNLPGGIENGIARLVDCKFTQIAEGKQNAGEWMFYAAGIVVSPSEHEGTQILGLRTMISEPLFDTPTRSRKTIDEHLAWVLNEFRKLGVNTDELSFDDLEGVAEQLVEGSPHFRFRTWKGSKQEIVKKEGKFFVGDKKYATEAAAKAANPYVGSEPMVLHQWGGAVEYQGDEGSDGAVNDQTGDSGTQANKVSKAPSTTKAPNKAPVSSAGVKTGSGPTQGLRGQKPKLEPPKDTKKGDGLDLDNLAEQADEGDVGAQKQLQAMAEAASVDYESLGTWGEVAAAVEEAKSSSQPSEEEGDGGSNDDIPFDELGAKADEGDQEAVDKLDAACRERGLNPDEYQTWSDAATALVEAGDGSGDGAGSEDQGEVEATEPKKGDPVFYKPPKARKAIECEVTAVFPTSKKVNLKSLDDGKSFKSVSWDELTAE
jgi:hypothetical protein